MPNIRIKDIPTTASATSSTDFIGIDGSANGTRKLNAYSPTFGGNLTVSGGTLAVTPSANDASATLKGRATGTNQLATSSRGSNVTLVNLDTTDNNCEAIAFQNSNELAIASIVAQNVSHTGRTGKLYVNISNGAAPAEALNIAADKTVTLAGNLTVSGNTNTFGSGTVDTDVIVNGGAVGSYSSALKYRSAGTEYWKVGRGAGTGGANFEWYDYQGTPGTRFTIASSTGNATLSGNLTVSGTGTSSFQSTTPPTVQIANTTSGLADTQTAANNVVLGTLKFGHPSDGQSDKFPSIVGRFDPTDASFARATQLEFYTSSPAGNALGMTLNKTGNVLIGTTADGGQKLQVSGSAIFGSTNTAQLSNPTGQIIRQQFSASTVGLRLEADSGNGHAVIGTSSNHSLVLRTNDTTALTVDSSQNILTSTNGIIYTNRVYNLSGGATPLTIGWTGSAGVISVFSSGETTFAGKVVSSASSASHEAFRATNTNTAGQVYINLNETNTTATPAYLIRYGSTHATKPSYVELVNGTSNAPITLITSGTAGVNVKGTATNDNAAAGYVGEYVSSTVASGSAVSLTTATAANVTSISLTAGDWDVEANIFFAQQAGTTSTYLIAGLNSTSATIPSNNDGGRYNLLGFSGDAADATSKPSRRYSLSATTTIYVVAQAGFSGGTCSAFGQLSARRVR